MSGWVGGVCWAVMCRACVVWYLLSADAFVFFPVLSLMFFGAVAHFAAAGADLCARCTAEGTGPSQRPNSPAFTGRRRHRRSHGSGHGGRQREDEEGSGERGGDELWTRPSVTGRHSTEGDAPVAISEGCAEGRLGVRCPLLSLPHARWCRYHWGRRTQWW